MMGASCIRNSVYHLNVDHDFLKDDLQLWSFRDGLHISEDRGLPLLLTRIGNKVASLMVSRDNESRKTQVPCTPKPRCPEWMWRELRHHNPLGKY